MKLGEAIYKYQEKKEGSPKEGDKNDEGKKDDNVVDADFEEVKEEVGTVSYLSIPSRIDHFISGTIPITCIHT